MHSRTAQQSQSHQPTCEAIAARAYEIWQEEGCPEGQAEQHWLRAEQELSSGSQFRQGGAGEQRREESQPAWSGSGSNRRAAQTPGRR